MTYAYNNFALDANSSGLGYFFLGKNIDLPEVTPTSFSIARRDGTTKSGEIIKERTITVDLRIVGSSRVDLISRIDALQQALSQRGKSLVIHEDLRYFKNVDPISAPVKFVAGKDIVSAACSIVFKVYDPYAYANVSSSYDTGTVTLTAGTSGIWNFPTINLTPNGTIYSYPLIRLIAHSTVTWTNITIVQTNDNTSLSVSNTTSVPLPATSGDYIDFQCDPSVSGGWTIQTNGSGKYSDPNGLFPVIEPGTTTFNISVAAASAPSAEALISWTYRYTS